VAFWFGDAFCSARGVRTIAAIPALALLAGCAAGLLWPSLPGSLEQSVLVAAVTGGVCAWWLARRSLLAASVAVAFFSGGSLLAERAWQDAWRPSLRVAYEELARPPGNNVGNVNNVDARPGTEESVTAAIVGVLRADASPTPVGASLSIDVQEIAAPFARAATGGVLLTVVGDRARDLVVISNNVVHSGLLGKHGRYHTFHSIREGAPSDASS
jgi:hypothetical protein